MSPKREVPQGGNRLHPLSVARILRKHWVEIALIFAIGTIAGFVIVRALPPIYKSETLILVESQKIPEKLVSSTVNSELQDRLATISQQILSATRLQQVIDKFGLYKEERRSLTQEEIIERMRKDINIKLERGWTRNQPGAFRISYQGPNPEIVAAVVNQLGTYFIDENLNSREQQAAGTSEFLTAQLQEAKKSLDELEAKVAQYKTSHNLELPEQENSLIAGIGGLHVQIQGNQDALLRAQQTRTMLESSLSAAQSAESVLLQAIDQATAPVARAADGTPIARSAPGATSATDREIDALRTRLEELRLRYTDNHPDVRITRQTLQALEARAKVQAAASATEAAVQEKQSKGSAIPERIVRQAPPELTKALLAERERITAIRAQLETINKEIDVRQADRQRLVNDMNSYQARVERLPIREQEMAALVRDYQISKGNYESLLKKSFEAGMATDMERRQKAERFTPLDPGRVPEKPAKPNRPLLTGIGAAAALVLALVWAFGREIKANVILGEWELPPDIVILGRVPLIEPRRDLPVRDQAVKTDSAVTA